MLVEICVNDYDSAYAAWKGGADRIEFCNNLYEGGTTPSPASVRQCLETMDIPCFPIIRCRGGNFVYSEAEKKIMLREIEAFKALGCPGVVIGALGDDGQLDIDFIKQAITLADGMEITFHKAFDELADPFAASASLKKMGITRVLTSGGPASAWEGKEVISELVKQGDCIILAGGGLRADNVKDFMAYTKVSEVHTSVKREESNTSYKRIYTTEDRVRAFVDQVKSVL